MRETIEDAQKSLVNKIKEAIDRGDHAAAAAYTHALGRLHDFSPLSLQHNSGGFPKQVGEMGMKWLPLIISVVVCGTTYFKTVADIRSANSAIQRNKDETNAQQQELAQKQAEIINNQMNQSREWNLKAIQFLDSKFPVLLGPESKQRTALINLIRNVYPPELSTPILNYAVSIQRSSGKPDSAKELVAVAGQIALGDRNTTVNIIVPEGTDSEIAKKMFELFSKQNPATQYETDREISKFPKSSEIRYYYREDQSTADAISNYINQKYGKTIVVKDNTERQGFRRHLISLYIRE